MDQYFFLVFNKIYSDVLEPNTFLNRVACLLISIEKNATYREIHHACSCGFDDVVENFCLNSSIDPIV